jgi:succinate dehydrogenase / fumarate reductase cytochrome b subunit
VPCGCCASGLIGRVRAAHPRRLLAHDRLNRKARSVKYQSPRDYQAANFASRTMRWTGVIVFLFLIWHLRPHLHQHRLPLRVRRGHAYGNVVRSFERMPVAVLYIVANLALGTHLFHGAWSLFQSMGWNNPRFNEVAPELRHRPSPPIVVVGNVSFPIAVLAGVVGIRDRPPRTRRLPQSARATRLQDPRRPIAEKWTTTSST